MGRISKMTYSRIQRFQQIKARQSGIFMLKCYDKYNDILGLVWENVNVLFDDYFNDTDHASPDYAEGDKIRYQITL